jgi:hypothetical protein
MWILFVWFTVYSKSLFLVVKSCWTSFWYIVKLCFFDILIRIFLLMKSQFWASYSTSLTPYVCCLNHPDFRQHLPSLWQQRHMATPRRRAFQNLGSDQRQLFFNSIVNVSWTCSPVPYMHVDYGIYICMYVCVLTQLQGAVIALNNCNWLR